MHISSALQQTMQQNNKNACSKHIIFRNVYRFRDKWKELLLMFTFSKSIQQKDCSLPY